MSDELTSLFVPFDGRKLANGNIVLQKAEERAGDGSPRACLKVQHDTRQTLHGLAGSNIATAYRRPDGSFRLSLRIRDGRIVPEWNSDFATLDKLSEALETTLSSM